MSQVKLLSFFVCENVCVSLITIISSTTSSHLHWPQNYFCCFLSPSRVLFPPPCLQQGLQVRQKSQRYNNSCITLSFRFSLSHHLSFCFSLLWEFCCILQTTEKTSAVCFLYKESQTNNVNPMNGRAFAISALFLLILWSLILSFLSFSLSNCGPVCIFLVLFIDSPLHWCAYYTPSHLLI